MPLSLQSVKNLAALIYGRQIRVLSGGSRWVSALPTQQSQALRITIRNADRLWPPKGPGELAMPVLCLRCVAPRGSKWNRALPGPYPSKRGPVVQF